MKQLDQNEELSKKIIPRASTPESISVQSETYKIATINKMLNIMDNNID